MPSDPAGFDYEAALAACAQGHHSALQSIYQQEASRMLGVALRIVRQRQLAEDIVHDSFLNIWNKAGSFDAQRGSGRGWIYSVVRNNALNAIRSSERETAAEDVLESDDGQWQGVLPDRLEVAETIGRLHGCLSRLDAPKRACILYAYVDGCSHGEIAQRLNAPLGTVKAWIRRGLDALRGCMA